MSDFPQFYVHFDMSKLKIVQLCREEFSENQDIKVFKVSEKIAKQLLNGEITENQLTINTFAKEFYPVSTASFPNTTFCAIFSISDLTIKQVTTKSKINPVILRNQGLDHIEIDALKAYSILKGDSVLDEWEIKTVGSKRTFEYNKNYVKKHKVYQALVNQLSLAEIGTYATGNNLIENPLVKITFDYNQRLISVNTFSSNFDRERMLTGCAIYITKKNDPSYLIKPIKIEIGTNTNVKLNGISFNDISIYINRFFLDYIHTIVVAELEGQIKITRDENIIQIDNSLENFDADTKYLLYLRNKYDHTVIYNAVDLKRFRRKRLEIDKLSIIRSLDFFVPNIDSSTFLDVKI